MFLNDHPFFAVNAFTLIVAGAFLCFSLRTLRQRLYLRKHGVSVQGQAIGKGWVRFVTKNGYMLEVYSLQISSPIGTHVDLLYAPRKPSWIWVTSSPPKLFSSICSLIFLILLIIFLVYSTILSIKSNALSAMALSVTFITVCSYLIFLCFSQQIKENKKERKHVTKD